MTILIADARRMVLVSDSQISDSESNIKYLQQEKVYEIPEGLIAGAGDLCSIQKVVEWFRNGKKDKEKPEIQADDDADFILLNNDGMFIINRSLDSYRVKSYDAIGSGLSIALGVMKLGHSAEDAAWAATQVDLGCGGDVKIYSLQSRPVIYKPPKIIIRNS
jgi:ATP-dependent protease HslVU (ClpYQ) peptidase subunit